MELLAWLTGAWKAGAWKVGAWDASGTPPQPPQNPLGGYAPRPRETRRREEEEALLLAALL